MRRHLNTTDTVDPKLFFSDPDLDPIFVRVLDPDSDPDPQHCLKVLRKLSFYTDDLSMRNCGWM
jgi:hypothetical protein